MLSVTAWSWPWMLAMPVKISPLFCAARSISQSFDGFCVSRQRPYQSVVFGRYSKPSRDPGTICTFFKGRIDSGEQRQLWLSHNMWVLYSYTQDRVLAC